MARCTVILDPIDQLLTVRGVPGQIAAGITTTDQADQVLGDLGATTGTWQPVGDHWPDAQQRDVIL